MFAEEEVELKDLITQYLETSGFLTKIKAQIRAGVYLALEDNGFFKSNNPLSNKKFDDFFQTDEGNLVVSIVREFLEFFNMKHTLSVFDPEVSARATLPSRATLCDKLNLTLMENDGPVLASLIKKNFTKENNNFTNSLIRDNNPEQKKESSDNKPTDTAKKLDTINDNILSKRMDTTNSLEDDNDSFFDEPLPKEKSNFLSELKNEDNVSQIFAPDIQGSDKKDDIFNKNSLTSLKNLPSLAGISSHSTDWSFSNTPRSTFLGMDKSIPSLSDAKIDSANDETHSDPLAKTNSKKDELVGDSSEKQISDESIEEEIEEDLSAGIEDLLNSSLSLADDATTDQTVSQVSVGGVDHMEQIDSLT